MEDMDRRVVEAIDDDVAVALCPAANEDETLFASNLDVFAALAMAGQVIDAAQEKIDVAGGVALAVRFLVPVPNLVELAERDRCIDDRQRRSTLGAHAIRFRKKCSRTCSDARPSPASI